MATVDQEFQVTLDTVEFPDTLEQVVTVVIREYRVTVDIAVILVSLDTQE